MKNLNEEDLQFLKELAHKRKTQEKDRCADPVYWMIQDEKNVFTDDGEYTVFFDDDGNGEIYNTYNNCGKEQLNELKEYMIDNCDITYDEVEEIKGIHDNNSLFNFIEWHDIDINSRRFTREYFISYSSGPFLTKKAAKQHLKDNYYHYSKNARTYGLVGWRNPEFERLMEIVEKFDEGELIC